MNIHVRYKAGKTPELERELQHQVEKLQRRLQVFKPDLIHNCMQGYEVRFECLQSALQFFDLMLQFAFYFGSLTSLVTDVDIHDCLRIGRTSRRKLRRPYAVILHLATETQLDFSALYCLPISKCQPGEQLARGFQIATS